MEKLKILIVEDELLTATDIQEKLESYGYKITGIAQTAGEALILAKNTKPDLILMDILLAGAKDGIEAAEMIRDVWNGPIIFLTGNSEGHMIERAKKVLPAAYILKPLNVNEFTINIDIAITNYFSKPAPRSQLNGSRPLYDAIFIPVDYCHQKILKKDLLFIEASGSYIHLYTTSSMFTISTNIGNIEKQIEDDLFLRISRKHIINLDHIDRIEHNVVVIDQHKLNIGESFKAKLMQQCQFIRTK